MVCNKIALKTMILHTGVHKNNQSDVEWSYSFFFVFFPLLYIIIWASVFQLPLHMTPLKDEDEFLHYPI